LRRVGLLGGSFDPPHGGHLRLAALAFECLTLDELRFVPAMASPQKKAPTAPPEARLTMLGAMLVGTPFAIETIEIESGHSPNYTVDTLEALSKREPDAAWILVMGMDQALGFRNWRDSTRVLELASIAVAPRPSGAAAESGQALPVALSSCVSSEWLGALGQAVLLPSTEMDISSGQIRERVASAKSHGDGNGRAALKDLPERVCAVISENDLYSRTQEAR
jgi:nicotinate-nucleotide adenylyltransferase